MRSGVKSWEIEGTRGRLSPHHARGQIAHDPECAADHQDHQDTREAKAIPRTDRSLPGTFGTVGVVVFMLCALLFFTFGLGIERAIGFALVGTILVTVIAFLFAPVSARAIAQLDVSIAEVTHGQVCGRRVRSAVERGAIGNARLGATVGRGCAVCQR